MWKEISSHPCHPPALEAPLSAPDPPAYLMLGPLRAREPTKGQCLPVELGLLTFLFHGGHVRWGTPGLPSWALAAKLSRLLAGKGMFAGSNPKKTLPLGTASKDTGRLLMLCLAKALLTEE